MVVSFATFDRLKTKGVAAYKKGEYLAAKTYLVDAAECRPRGGLPNFVAKLKKGGDVRIAYLGGSITNAEGWRPMTCEWFDRQYFNAKVDQILRSEKVHIGSSDVE